MKINSRKDIEEVAQKASELADEEYLKTGRPDTKWELVMPTNIRYYISYTGFVTGVFEGKHHPGYIYWNKNIMVLHKNKHGKYYEDHLCFFRCLAYHRLQTVRGLEELTLQFVEHWKAYKHLPLQTVVQGVDLQDFADLENCFDINIDVYQLKKVKNLCRPHLQVSKCGRTRHYQTEPLYLTGLHGFKRHYRNERSSQLHF